MSTLTAWSGWQRQELSNRRQGLVGCAGLVWWLGGNDSLMLALKDWVLAFLLVRWVLCSGLSVVGAEPEQGFKLFRVSVELIERKLEHQKERGDG